MHDKAAKDDNKLVLVDQYASLLAVLNKGFF